MAGHLIQINAAGCPGRLLKKMRNFIFRCPTTKLNVQGSIGNQEAESDEFVAVSCLACGLVHIVSPKTGRQLSDRPPPRSDK